MELIFIVNPNSGGEKGFKVWKRLKRWLEMKGYQYKVYITDHRSDARSIAESLTSNLEDDASLTIAVVGGDGTINEVLNGLHIDDRITLGLIPAGSGNDLARGLRLPKNPIVCLKKILRCKKLSYIDYGIISYGESFNEHRRFLVSSGIGYDAAITQSVHSKKNTRIRLPRLSYIIEGILGFFKFHTSSGYIILDNSQRHEYGHMFFVSAHIHQYEGGGFRFAPKALNSDGLLTLCVVHASSKRKLFKILLSSKLGNHLKYAGVRSYDCRELTVHSDRPLPVHADGEGCYMQNDIRIECIKGKLKFIS